jgi:hypothetical protein
VCTADQGVCIGTENAVAFADLRTEHVGEQVPLDAGHSALGNKRVTGWKDHLASLAGIPLKLGP